MIKHTLPEIEWHDGVYVARDLLSGGTKSRYIWQLYQRANEIVYASSAEGGAQVALAATAQRWGKRATVFGPARATPHPRQLEVQRLGGKFIGVKPGYLNVVQARAREYAECNGALLAPFGMAVPNATDVIAETAQALKIRPDVVWCAAGSGTLARGLRKAWPGAEFHAVQVGAPVDLPGAEIHVYPKPYAYVVPADACPFDACGNYERKCWSMLKAWGETRYKRALVLMWSPMNGPKA